MRRAKVGSFGERRGRWLAAAAMVLSLGCATPRQAWADDDPAVIVLYDGFGTVDGATLGGRVLEDQGLDRPRRNESWYRRVKRSVQLLESDEIPHAELELKVLGRRQRIKADKEGLFRLALKGPLPAGEHRVSARLLRTKRRQRTIEGRLQVWPRARSKGSAAPVAVVSDIDDTVLESGVTNKKKLIWRLLTRNATQLKSYAGAPALYRALRARGYPIVFVSGSPVNLYPRLRHFFARQRFPRAPMLLKNLGLSKGSDKLFGQRAYKLRQIATVQRLLPGYRLLLIGDSGEKDPEIYAAVQRQAPERVVATLIHRVTDEKASSRRFAGQLLFARYAEAARELRRRRLIAAPVSAPKRRVRP